MPACGRGLSKIAHSEDAVWRAQRLGAKIDAIASLVFLVVVPGLNQLLLLDYWSNLLSGRRWRGHFGEIRAVVLLIR